MLFNGVKALRIITGTICLNKDVPIYSTLSSIFERFKAQMQTERKPILKVEGARKV
jgi:hypothetical protein